MFPPPITLSSNRSTPPIFLAFCEMAPAVGNKRGAVQRKTDAIGFPRRQARKKARHSTGLDDVYEFQPEKVRRSKVVLDLTKEELAGLGRGNASDSDGDNHRSGQSHPRLIGQNSEDEGVDSEDDEDIDSDAAFGESDEETFAGYGFARKVRCNVCYHISKPTHSSLRRVNCRKRLSENPQLQKKFTLRSILMKAMKKD